MHIKQTSSFFPLVLFSPPLLVAFTWYIPLATDWKACSLSSCLNVLLLAACVASSRINTFISARYRF